MSSLPNCIASPPWWQLITWVADPLKFQDRYRQQFGDLFTMRLGKISTCVVIGDPPAVQDIFSQSSKFDVGRGNTLAAPLVGENSLMLMDGDHHRRERKLLMPPFHGERLQTYASQICTIANQVVDQWSLNSRFTARREMQKVSLEVILQIVFGLTEGDRYQELRVLLSDLLDMTDSPLRSSLLFFEFLQKDLGPWSPWGHMERVKARVHHLLQAEIDDRRANSNADSTDILSFLMAARDEQGQPMTNAELRDELITLLFAGHETTATMLAWALYQIHRHPAVLDNLLQELRNAGPEAAPLEIAKLPYLSAVCQETLRMYPVIPVIFPRIAKVPVQVGGQTYDAGTTFMVSMYLVHYREDLYPNPHEFRPERFLERDYSPAEYLPFGGGNRRCLGYALAELELKLVLATIVTKCQLALAEKTPVPVQRRGFTLSPKGGVKMTMTGRRSLTSDSPAAAFFNASNGSGNRST